MALGEAGGPQIGAMAYGTSSRRKLIKPKKGAAKAVRSGGVQNFYKPARGKR